MNFYAYYEYVNYNGEKFFTVVCLPKKDGQFPIIVCRSPYVNATREKTEEQIVNEYLTNEKAWLDNGYAVVIQHCRGNGKSSGAFTPYIYEREDGLELRSWIRKQPFYNGELFLVGASYTASLHYATAPFEEDIKGAIFEVQDSNRYRLWYRNGQMRKGHANWHFALFNDGKMSAKNYTMQSFSELPLKGLSKRALGIISDDFEQMLDAEKPTHEFWNTRNGGIETLNAVIDSKIPILLTTGYNDFYVGGVFDMWDKLNSENKENCALLVSPYDHGDGFNKENGIEFINGKRTEAFGNDYKIKWIEHIRKGTDIPFKKGVVTYYRTFENGWETDYFATKIQDKRIQLGNGIRAFIYDPVKPTAFNGEGLKAEESMDNAIAIYTEKFDKEVFVKGKIKVKLAVSSSAKDTSFYVRISLDKGEYAYVLRHDITSLNYALGDYTENQVVELDFIFDEYAFLIKKGERIRLDIASTDDNVYVPHTNQKGKYYLQTKSQKATNRIYLDNSFLILPIEI